VVNAGIGVKESVAGGACRVPARPYSLVKSGRRGEGPGRENSLASLGASLTNSPNHSN